MSLPGYIHVLRTVFRISLHFSSFCNLIFFYSVQYSSNYSIHGDTDIGSNGHPTGLRLSLYVFLGHVLSDGARSRIRVSR